jgi:hypothetical protein
VVLMEIVVRGLYIIVLSNSSNFIGHFYLVFIRKKVLNYRVRKYEALFRYNYPKIFYLVHDMPRNVWKGSKKRVPEKTKKFIKQKILKQKQGFAP